MAFFFKFHPLHNYFYSAPFANFLSGYFSLFVHCSDLLRTRREKQHFPRDSMHNARLLRETNRSRKGEVDRPACRLFVARSMRTAISVRLNMDVHFRSSARRRTARAVFSDPPPDPTRRLEGALIALDGIHEAMDSLLLCCKESQA